MFFFDIRPCQCSFLKCTVESENIAVNFLFPELKVAVHPCEKNLPTSSLAFHIAAPLHSKSLSDLASYIPDLISKPSADFSVVTLNFLPFVPLSSLLCWALVFAVLSLIYLFIWIDIKYIFDKC